MRNALQMLGQLVLLIWLVPNWAGSTACNHCEDQQLWWCPLATYSGLPTIGKQQPWEFRSSEPAVVLAADACVMNSLQCDVAACKGADNVDIAGCEGADGER